MSYELNIKSVNQHIKDGFDISKREIKIDNHCYFMCFLNSLSDMKLINELIKGIYFSNDKIHFDLFSGAINEYKYIDDTFVNILSGQTLLLYQNRIYLIETRNYPNRSTNEAKNEQSIRGSHDSFTENIILNVGLIRRRIRDENLKVDLMKIGAHSNCDIACLYIEPFVNNDLLDKLKENIHQIKDKDIMYDRAFVDSLFKQNLNPYPKVRFSERPDVCSIHLLQGYIILIIDNSFNAIILPTTFFELSKQIEEYTQSNIIAFIIRLIRLLAIFISLYLLPIWLLFEMNIFFNLDSLNFSKIFSVSFQVLLIELLIEWIRLSFIHTPQSIAGILGFLFIFLLGDSAIKLNFYSEIILVVVVLCNVCNFVTPNYELSLANKLFRILFAIATLFLGCFGFILSIIFHFVLLLKTNSFYTPYLYPLIPFNFKEMKRLLVGGAIKIKK